jgi:GT2 family glycosyltransferase
VELSASTPHQLVSFVIVSCDGRKFLVRCLPSVFSQDYPAFEVVVVINGSSDGSVEWLQAHYPQIKLIANDENLGYCTGANQGIRQSEGAYVIVLDDDTELQPGFLAAMVAAAESGADVGMAASQILFDHDASRIDSAGIEVDWAGLAWNRHVGLPADGEPTQPIDVFGPTGAAGLYAKKMLDQIGLLDEDYFIYYDDADIAWRGQRAGWRCVYAPAAKVRHVHSGTTGKWSPFKTYLLGRNKLWTIVKNYELRSLLIHLPVIILFEMAAIFYGIFVLRNGAALWGRLAALRKIALPLAKRRQFNQKVQRTRPVKLAPVRSPIGAWKMHRSVPHS